MDSLFDENKLNQFMKPQLVELFMELQREKNVLKRQQESQSELADRVNEHDKLARLIL